MKYCAWQHAGIHDLTQARCIRSGRVRLKGRQKQIYKRSRKESPQYHYTTKSTMKIYQLLSLAVAAFPTALAEGYPPKSSCTKTIKPTSFTCCGTIAAHTTTSYTNCHGCALEYEPTPQCRCVSNPVTDFKLTSTETACAATSTAKCLTTATYTANGCGDCGHTYATTKTSRVDCKGCHLVATTTTGPGICMCPTATETTVKACKASPKPTTY